MPKLVNLVTHMANVTVPGAQSMQIDTALPGTPQRLCSCAEPVRMTTPRKRFGEDQPHGLSAWLPKIDDQSGPDICGDNTNIWLSPLPCQASEPCYVVFAQPQRTAPLVDWSTPPIPCTGGDQPDAIMSATIPDQIEASAPSWQNIGIIQNVVQPPLAAYQAGAQLPSYGSFSFTAAAHWPYTPDGQKPALRVIDDQGNVLKQSQPWSNDGRPCSGSACSVKRSPITRANMRVVAQMYSWPGFGDFFRIGPPSLVLVRWWAT